MLLITVLKYLFGYFVVVPSFKDINNFYSLLQYIQNEYLYSLLIYIWNECCSYKLHFARYLAFLQHFIYATNYVTSPTTGHWIYILCILPFPTKTYQQGYFEWMWAS